MLDYALVAWVRMDLEREVARLREEAQSSAMDTDNQPWRADVLLATPQPPKPAIRLSTPYFTS